jgi:8-oxo-dGTP diphosphatase
MNQNADKLINVVAGLIYRDGRLLVCQRRGDGAFPLKWEFPGGKVEKGETDIGALKRELREELTIEVRAAALIYQQSHLYPSGPAVSLRFYAVDDFEGVAQNLIFETIAWVTLPELEQIDFLEGDRPFVQRLISEGEPILLQR